MPIANNHFEVALNELYPDKSEKTDKDSEHKKDPELGDEKKKIVLVVEPKKELGDLYIAVEWAIECVDQDKPKAEANKALNDAMDIIKYYLNQLSSDEKEATL